MMEIYEIGHNKVYRIKYAWFSLYKRRNIYSKQILDGWVVEIKTLTNSGIDIFRITRRDGDWRLNKYYIYLESILISLIFIIGTILIPIWAYLLGAKHFVTDEFDNSGVRYFGWVNIAIIIFLSIIMMVR